MVGLVAVVVTWLTSAALGVWWVRLRAVPERSLARRNLAGWFWVLAPCALALTLGLHRVGTVVDRAVGLTQFSHLFKHLLGLGPLRLLLLRAEALARPARATRSATFVDRLTRQWWVVALVLIACYALSPDRESLMEAVNGLGGVTGIVYWTFFLGYFSVPCISFAVSTLRFRRMEREPTDIRAAQTLLAVSGVAFVIYCLTKLMFVASSASALIQEHGRAVTSTFMYAGFVFLCLGAGRSRVSMPRWLRPLQAQSADLARAGFLRQLWSELVQATPGIRARLLTPTPALRLERREREVSDGLTKISDWVHPGDRVHAEQVIAARRDDEALITAVVLELARRRKLAGEAPARITATETAGMPRSFHLDDGPMLQRLATAWPEAAEVCDTMARTQRVVSLPDQVAPDHAR